MGRVPVVWLNPASPRPVLLPTLAPSPMTHRLLAAALFALASLSGCAWEDRPDGGDPLHRGTGDYTRGVDARYGLDGPSVAPITDPYDVEALPSTDTAPVPLDQPEPVNDLEGSVSGVEEALTPGGDN